MTNIRQTRLLYEKVPCPLCGTSETRTLFQIPNRTRNGVHVNGILHPIAETHTIVRCRQCGLLFANPRLARVDGMRTYSTEEEMAYFTATRADREVGNAVLLDTFERLRYGGRLLDAGCGDGLLLAQAAARGWESWGIERSSSLAGCIRDARNQSNVVIGDIARLPFSSSSFDVVCLINVIEHVPDPMLAISEVARVTRPNGAVAVHTPNAGGLPARIYRAHWYHYDPVEHLYYFTRKTLQMMLERHGFEILGTLELPKTPGAKRLLLSFSQKLRLSLGNGLGLIARKRPDAVESE